MPPHPDFRAVVLQHERHAVPARDSDSGVVVQTVSLIDERRPAPADRGIGRRVKGIVQEKGRQLPEIPEGFGRRDKTHLDAAFHRRDVVGREHLDWSGEAVELVEDAGDVGDRAAGAHAKTQIGAEIERRGGQVQDRRLPSRPMVCGLDRFERAFHAAQQRSYAKRLGRELRGPAQKQAAG